MINNIKDMIKEHIRSNLDTLGLVNSYNDTVILQDHCPLILFHNFIFDKIATNTGIFVCCSFDLEIRDKNNHNEPCNVVDKIADLVFSKINNTRIASNDVFIDFVVRKSSYRASGEIVISSLQCVANCCTATPS